MKRSWIVVLLLLSVGLNVGLIGSWLARRAGRDEPRPFDWGRERGPFVLMADRLGLDGETRRDFLEQQRIFLQLTQDDRRDLELARRELRRELVRSEPDPVRVEELLAESAALNADLDRAFVANLLATRDLLSPEQQRRYLLLLPRLRRPPPDPLSGPTGLPGDATPGP